MNLRDVFYWIVIFGLMALLIMLQGTTAQQGEKIARFEAEIEELKKNNREISIELNTTRTAYNQSNYLYNTLLKDYTRKNIIFQSPATGRPIEIWKRQQVVKPNGLIQWALLDTFVNHIDIQTNQTIHYLILDLNNYVNFRTGKAYVAIEDRTGQHFKTDQYFTQGCGTYVLVILNKSNTPILLRPNVTATYAWTPFLTGQCALP